MKYPTLLLAAALLATPGRPGAEAADAGHASGNAARRPDIVLVVADDVSWHDLGCFGSPNARTPHLDRLASQGMRLTCCFTATAMCAPTRQQLYTGLFPVRNGAYPNHSGVYPGVRSIVHHLRDLGYRVGLCGKTHFKPRESFPFEILKPAAIADFIRRDTRQPYCLLYCSHNAHAPWTAGDPAAIDPDKLTVPPYLVDTPQMRQALQGYLAEISALDQEVGSLMQQVDSTGRPDNTLFIFTSEQGSGVPFAKWTCYDAGLRTATIIRWPGRIKPGTTSDALVQYVDILPTLIEAAGGDPTKIDTGIGGAPDGGCGFDGRSFLPVLLGRSNHHRDLVFGVHTTRGIVNGTDCYPIRSVRDRRYKLIWNLNHQATFTNYVTRTDTNRHFYWASWLERARTDPAAAQRVRLYQHRPRFELYDLQNDPYELHNLAGDPAHADRIAAMKKQLDAWMKQQGDRGIPTEMNAFQRQGRGGRNKPADATKTGR